MAAKKTIAQLSNDVLKVAEQLKALNAQLAGLPKGTDAFKKALSSVEEITKKLAKSREELAKTASTLAAGNIKHKSAIEQSTKALKDSEVVIERAKKSIKALADEEKKAAEQKRKTAEKQLKELEAQAIREFKLRAAELNKRRAQQERELREQQRARERAEKERTRAEEKAASERAKRQEREAKERLRQEEKNQREINRILSNSRKEAEREASRQAKSNDFFGALRGSFTPEKIGSSLGTVTRFLGIGSAVFAVVDGLKQLTTESVRVFAQLEKGFAQLSAVSGATTEQMRLLQKQTFDVAASTGYTTSEIIELQTNLVKLGIPIQDVSSSIQGIAVAAKAMGVDLSQVGEAVFRVSNQFGLGASESSVTAAILTRAVNESALTFQEFGTAIQYVGPVAKQAGLSFRETAGYMQILSDAGFKSSKIGTGLRDIFIDLKQPGESLSETILRLSKENIGLSEAVDLVGKTSASQFLVLLRNADIIEKLSSETYSAKMATEDLSQLLLQTSKNMSTLSATTASLSTAWESYKFGIGGAITQTELLLDILDELDKKAAQTARAYRAIQYQPEKRIQGAVNDFRQGRMGTAVTQLALPTTLGELDDKQEALLNKFFNAGMDLQKLNQSDRLLVARLLVQEEDAVNELIGIYKLLEEQAKAVELEREAISIRNMQRAKYQVYLDSVEAASGEQKIEKADKLNKAFYAEELRLRKKYNSAVTEEDKRQAKLQLQAQLDLSAELDELVSGETERLEEEQKERDKNKRLREEEQRKEVKRIKDIIEARKREYQALVDTLEIDRKLALAKGDIEGAAKIELQLIDARAKAYADLSEIIDTNTIISPEQRFDLTGDIKNFIVNEKDIRESAEKLVAVYKEALSAKGLMQGSQIGDAIVEDFIAGVEKSIGALPNAEKDRIRELIRLLVYGGTGTELKVKGDKDAIEKRKKEIEDAIKALTGLTSAFSDGVSELNDVALDNLKNRLNSEKDAIKERYDYEQKILESQVENQLITQEEYERKLEQVQKKRIQKENQINKKIFEAEKKRDRQNATLQFAETLANIYLNNLNKFDTLTAAATSIVGAVTAATQYGLKLSAINQREFVPVRFAEGGLVNGPSHAEGGVPFSVQGRGGYEMEGGEFIVNKEATKRNYSLLKNINDSVKPSKYSTGKKFAAGGLVNAEEMSMRQVELLEAIARATGGTYINTAKPVRAFVATEDLRKSDVDLRIRERNSNL